MATIAQWVDLVPTTTGRIGTPPSEPANHRRRRPRRKGRSMKTVSVVAVFIVAIGALIPGFIGEMKGQQPVTPTSMQVPFLHELASGATANPAQLTSLERADARLN